MVYLVYFCTICFTNVLLRFYSMGRVTFKLFQRKDQQNKFNESPVYVRITINRKLRYVSTGVFLLPKYWDAEKETVKLSTPNYEEYDLFFAGYKTKIKRAVINIQNSGQEATFDLLIPRIHVLNQGKDFIGFCEQYLEKNPDKLAVGTLEVYHSRLERLRAVYPELPMHQIDKEVAHTYYNRLKAEVSEYTISNNMAFFKKMWLKAKAQKLILTKENIFEGLKLNLRSETEKDHLVFEERQLIFDFMNSDKCSNEQRKALRWFMIGCYSGLRYSDWDQCRNIMNGEMVVYQKKKGGKSKAKRSHLRIPVEKGSRLDELIQELPERLRITTRDNINAHLRKIVKLVGIKKKITTHCARHSFIVMCLNEAQIDIGMVAELVGDSIETLMAHYAKYVTAGKRKAMNKLNGL
ncbi:MAG: phage integrase SAM-like domain-containing protein [Flammeovirgaceae bacterium]